MLRSSTIDIEPTDAERDEALQLFAEGWLPVSNQYRLVGWAPVPLDLPAALKKVSPHVDPKRWKGSIADLRDSLARGTGASKEVAAGVYSALKKLCGPHNRGNA